MLKYFDRKKLFVFIASIFLGVLIISPQLQVKELTPLDFDESLYQGRDLTVGSAFLNSLRESHRFIPVRYMNRFFEYHIFGFNSRLYYLTNGLVLGVIIFFSFLILGSFSNLNRVVFFLIILLLPQLVDNFYRLGTAEPLFTLFILSGIYFLTAGKFILFVISFLLILTSKENALFLAPIFIAFSYSEFKRIKNKLFSIIFPYVFSTVFIINSYFNAGEERYFSQYTFNIANSVSYLSKYLLNDWPAFLLLIIATVIYFWKNNVLEKNKKLKLSLLILLGWVSLLPLTLLYESYYLFPTLVFSALSFLIAAEVLKMNFGKRIILYSLFILMFIITQLPKTLSLAESWHSKQVGDAALTRYLLDEREKTYKPTYYLLNKDLQNINGAWLVLSDFGNRDVDFKPAHNLTWHLYQKNGEQAINELVDTTRTEALSTRQSVLIENPCIDGADRGGRMTPLCGSSDFLKTKVCHWCTIR